MLTAQVTVIILLRNIQAAQIAREVDGGVELLGKGEVELILPEELSFTIKSPGPFDGIAKMCYAAQTNSHRKQVIKY
uniref:DUF4097 domain-containing protein n=1 Tax=Panagrellus redivivus TaxID=6233 RepID=A0A7E4VW59_PANRE